MLGKPTVATVPPNFTPRLGDIGNGANRPSAFSNARSLAASTFAIIFKMNKVKYNSLSKDAGAYQIWRNVIFYCVEIPV
jgi:hypothetical protein